MMKQNRSGARMDITERKQSRKHTARNATHQQNVRMVFRRLKIEKIRYKIDYIDLASSFGHDGKKLCGFRPQLLSAKQQKRKLKASFVQCAVTNLSGRNGIHFDAFLSPSN